MPIKRREKPLTPEEAIALAKKDLAPFWFGCPEPLMAAVRKENGVQAYPLDARMTDRAWLIFFVDPFALSSRDAFLFAQSWANRYEPQKLNVMVIMKTAHSFSADYAWRRKFAQHFDSPVVSVFDRDGLLHEAFQVQQSPRAVIFHQNKQIFDRSGPAWFQGAELEIQNFLRHADPGLPLFEPMAEPAEPVQDADLISFARQLDETSVTLQGKWTHEGDRIITQDPQSSVRIRCQSKRVGLVAQTLSERGESEIIVELPREYPRDGDLLGEDLKLDFQVLSNPLADPMQKRRASVKIGVARLYSLFRGLPASHREITLRFPGAEKAPVALYGLRQGS
jgi:hypothetical protein